MCNNLYIIIYKLKTLPPVLSEDTVAHSISFGIGRSEATEALVEIELASVLDEHVGRLRGRQLERQSESLGFMKYSLYEKKKG